VGGKVSDFDVVVVGAGPAGSSCAYTLASGGVNVLVLEMRQEIGAPKRCAEGINEEGLLRVGISPDPKWAVNKITGALLYSPSGKNIEIVLTDEKGYIIERKVFEKYLAERAINAGARYMVKTRAISVVKRGGRVCGVVAEHMGEEFTVDANIVVAADGVDSKIAKSAGLSTVNKLSDYHAGVQYDMAGVDVKKDRLHIFFGPDVAPKGYAWIFPKGGTLANVGLGILGSESTPERNAKAYLDDFIGSHPEFFEKASPVEINTGGIPVSASAKTFVGDGLMVVGDAAHQVNPIHGGGIALALNAGKLAGEVAAEAIRAGDFSRNRLLEYERRWRKTDGVKMHKLFRLRAFLEKLENEDFESLVDILSGKHITRLTDGDFTFLPGLLLRKMPQLAPLVKKMLS